MMLYRSKYGKSFGKDGNKLLDKKASYFMAVTQTTILITHSN